MGFINKCIYCAFTAYHYFEINYYNKSVGIKCISNAMNLKKNYTKE